MLLGLAIPVFLLGTSCRGTPPGQEPGRKVERWGIYEAEFRGPSDGNPFLEVSLTARFRQGDRVLDVEGFYDGEGVYRIRFMPDRTGDWTYVTRSNRPELDGKSGSFECVGPSPGNRGPVRVRNTFHFGHEDGTPYFPFGTTCYVWTHQPEELQELTLATLKASPFNKIRMCVFPKHYDYNRKEPPRHPFQKREDGKPDFARFNPEFFRRFERRVGDLGALGIEADVILFHPYDRWGYAKIPEEDAARYLRYVIARLAAYRNVWWSMANEYEFLPKPWTRETWDRLFQLVEKTDPYGHLRSIHNGDTSWDLPRAYDWSKPWVTHVCIQHPEVKMARDWRRKYGKPVIDDECEYEGDLKWPWGNLSAREMVHRFWVMVASGCYAGHGETYLDPEEVLWWSHGGRLRGESPPRIAFLRRIVEEGPPEGLEPIREDGWIWQRVSGASRGGYRLIYFGEHQPRRWSAGVPKDTRFRAEVLDTWEMTVTGGDRVYEPRAEIELPGKPWQAVRIRPAP